MKICLVVRAMPVHRLGGLEFHTLDLANALGRAGHQVVVVTSAHPDGKPAETLESGVEVRYLRTGRPGDYSAAFFRNVEGAVAELEREQPFDIVHAQEFAGLFLRPRRGRTVMTVHGTMFTEVPLDRRYRTHLSMQEKARAAWKYKARLALHPLFQRALKRVDRLIVDSEFTFRELMQMNGNLRAKTRIVELGIDAARYTVSPIATGSADEPPRIALLGRVQRIKGVFQAVRAAALLRDRGVPFEMVIGGGGEDLVAMRREISDRNLDLHVRTVGRVAPDAVGEFFARADLFLFPDLTQPAFGLVAVEAMLHGLPVVGARSGAIPEVVTEQVGWLYDPWNAAELAGLLERLAGRERGELISKANRAQAHAARYSADRMAAGAVGCYRELLERSQG